MKSKIFHHAMSIACILFTSLSAGTMKRPPMGENQFFILKSFVTASSHSDSLNLICYAKVSNSQLQFVKIDSLYKSRYEWTIQIRDKNKKLVGSSIIPGSDITPSFQETTNPKIFQKQIFRFILAEGTYEINLELFDMETRKGTKYNDEIVLKLLQNEPIESTDILFFSDSECDDPLSENIFPLFPAFRGEKDSLLSAFFVIYAQEMNQPLSIVSDILNANKKAIYTDTLKLDQSKSVIHVFIPIPQKISFGQYEYRMTAQIGSKQISKSAAFSVRWGAHTEYLPGFRQSIDVLVYAMEPNDFNRIRSLPTEEQIEALREFWKKRDPTPSTPENELEDEYYSRVLYANQHFSYSGSYQSGWQTDRGRIYIMYGPPSDIEHPQTTTMETSKFEIWYYRDLQKRFIFRDQMGLGDYRLFQQE